MTGYSNAVSLSPGGGGGGCLNLEDVFLTLQRSGFGDDGSSTQDIGTSTGGGGCPPGTVYFAYYQPTGSTTVYRLVQQPLGVPVFQIPSQPASAGHGRYWFTAADPATLVKFDQSPAVIDDPHNTTQNTQSASSPASHNLRYAHRDHLGSTRLLTDERGIEIGRWKYFPFGMEAESAGSGGQRMKFTGHERDGGVGLDYMLANYYGSRLGRFLSVDPAVRFRANRPRPQRWNRNVYVLNNVLQFFDPDGKDLRLGPGANKTLAALHFSVPAADRTAITVRTDKSGVSHVIVDNSHKSNDGNFKNIQKAANSPGIVQINQVPGSQPIPFRTADGTLKAASLDATNDPGRTLPTQGTRGDPAAPTSTQPGVTEVYVASELSAYDQAPVVAAELAGHAVPGLVGEGAFPSSSQEHEQREDPAIDGAIKNRDRK